MNRRAALVTTAAILLVAFAWFVWPTIWTYERVQHGAYNEVVVRINRVTGHADALIPGQGWEAWTPPPNPFDKIK